MEKNSNKTNQINIINIDLIKYLSNYKLLIEGIDIYFPYKPYPPQEKYMEKVILTLKNKGNISALESPTGTGKTLCLLCSVLAWAKHNKDKNINIYYCTRTISQIKNIMHELNKTCYKVATSFLASRKLCCMKFNHFEKREKDSSQLIEMCKTLRNEKLCEFYGNKNYDFNNYNNLEDIEDLFKNAKKNKFCPYFYNINKSESFANITFLSYNYILNPFIRKKLGKAIKNNSIIILDEAHNISNIFEGLYTNKLDLEDITLAKDSLQIILDNINIINQNDKYEIKIKEAEIDEQIKAIKYFINFIKPLKCDKNETLKKLNDENYYLCNALFFQNKFKNFSLNIYEKIDKISNILMNNNELEWKYKTYNKKYTFKSIMKKPKKIYEFLYRLKSIKKDEELSFKYILYPSEKDIDINDKLNNLIFEIYCIDASYGMRDLLKISPYSIILTSGTLSINNLENLLQIHFKEVLQNEHVINKERTIFSTCY